MEDKLFDELCESIKEAKQIAKGKLAPAKVDFTGKQLPITEIRQRFKLSQAKFAKLLGVSVDSLQNWEQGRRNPTGSAKMLLRVAALHPMAILDSARELEGK
ncbi:MAG: hypothetical protein A2600_14105 [Candidatus Lambdaproteobacteria bacterium RIFOXYD1_FULL_56_27]|uniref:HTH cro/C1-type domain-containing protein n=1 Tax=Candidatus Lambdaproteobacteria bacterium RIFOXYD2_FULL_56_26 TaxID=1817773 RepID=A0A1F6H1C5_9PROT|nr:MAG: hypothetical protein A2557_14140 [Candidatus Lambdaproteobacteria bacterium RIFOXYD2_FULL_56_26]OGH08270.1 MAG: hypothetical protein A2600_14105 [Candidatus Lambdaproteobacteria bacterium RIFOXYD1_FULL_56_27]